MTRCADCTAKITLLRNRGYTYSARQVNGGSWEVAFLRQDGARRAKAETLHAAIGAATGEFVARAAGAGVPPGRRGAGVRGA